MAEQIEKNLQFTFSMQEVFLESRNILNKYDKYEEYAIAKDLLKISVKHLKSRDLTGSIAYIKKSKKSQILPFGSKLGLYQRFGLVILNLVLLVRMVSRVIGNKKEDIV